MSPFEACFCDVAYLKLIQNHNSVLYNECTMKILIYDTHTEHVLFCKLHGVRPAFTGDILLRIIPTVAGGGVVGS